MNPNPSTQELRSLVLRNLSRVAPEVDPTTLDPVVPFREQLDLDSMDYFNFVLSLHKDLMVDIPERDYQKLNSLEGCLAYLASIVKKRSE